MNQLLSTFKGRELRNSTGLAWLPGLQVTNSNGDVDPATLGYQYTIQTTSFLRTEVIKQKFYTVPIADYIPVIIGTGAWMENIKTNLTYDIAGAFEGGNISSGQGPSELAEVNVGLGNISQKIVTWAKGYRYTVPEVNKALAADRWDVVSDKMEALKRHWDLGIQKIAFLGSITDLVNVPGLYTNPNVVVNTSLITANISGLSTANFATLVSSLMGAYFSNSNATALPDTLLVPMDDFLGLVTPVASGYPNVSMITYLQDAFAKATGNPDFMIRGMAYGMTANNAGYVSTNGKQRYVLYRNDRNTLRLDIPVPFQLTPPGTSNNFQFQGVGAGQYSGTVVFHPAEVMYFDH